MAHANEDLMRKAYDAFNSGDMDTLGELFADDAVFHTPGTSAISGDFKGKDAIFADFAKVAELSDNTYQAELHDVLANDEHVVALHVGKAQKGGTSYENPEVVVAHVRDGKLAEVWDHVLDQKAEQEFFG